MIDPRTIYFVTGMKTETGEIVSTESGFFIFLPDHWTEIKTWVSDGWVDERRRKYK